MKMMRRKDREITDREAIDSILNEAEICRIAMCRENVPYVVPVNFGYDGKKLYFHCAKEGRKIDFIKANETVCFEAETKTEIVKGEDACSCSMKFLSAIGMGKARLIEDTSEKVKALDVIMSKYSPDISFQFKESALNRLAVVEIEVTEISGKKAGY
jgi:nitroimidazol reductase NimA-like FMN-containing flavoprotein (pyridoxamine 5'-phosphate oxidase superfamily)